MKDPQNPHDETIHPNLEVEDQDLIEEITNGDDSDETVSEIIADPMLQISETVARLAPPPSSGEKDPASEDFLAGGSEGEPAEVREETLPAISEFAEASLIPEVVAAITAMGWTSPTTVQGMCLPYTLQGRDVAGFAQTGTGKTGVFLITIAQMLLKSAAAREKGEVKSTSPQAIVIVPTRELAIQIMEEATKLFSPLSLSTLAIYGGMDWEEQASKLQRGVDLMVGTCGRLKDYYEKKFFSFDATKIFVCDEVDRMFDMGFVSDVEVFLESLPVNCQRLFFSATSNEKVKELSFEYLTKPVYISAQTDELTPTNIEQHALLCETPDKLKVLLGLWAEHKPERAIIFTNTKLTAAWLQYKLLGNGITVDLITGDLPQAKRIQLIRRIKNGEIKALIATDVASRGLHISGVSHVYNFDLPDDANNYVHRIGRTARAGAEGKSYSLVCEEYGANFLAIQELLGESAPHSSWYDPAYLQIQDKAGNPFEDNFGKGIVTRPSPVSSRSSREAPRYGREQGQQHPSRERGREQGRERGEYPRSSYQERNERQRRSHEGQDRHRGRGRDYHRRDDRRHGKVVAKAKATPTFGQIIKRIFNLLAFWKKKK